MNYNRFMTSSVTQIAQQTYSKIAKAYSDQYFTDLSDAPYLDKFIKLIPVGGKILDIGSGPGQFSRYLHERGFEVIGIDFSDEMISIARKKVPEITFLKMDMRNLEFPLGSFAGILSAYSLIHIPSSQIPTTLAGFYRILQPGGFMEIIAQKGKANQIVDEPFLPTEKMFFNFFTKDRLSKFIKRAGFRIVLQEEQTTTDPNSVGTSIIYTIAQKI